MPINIPQQCVLVTQNLGKAREFTTLFQSLGIQFLSLPEVGFNQDIHESGHTFAENSQIKATALIGYTNMPILADDSGLSVFALGGEPGVYSARYAGEQGNDGANNLKLLQNLKEQSNRGAEFICDLCFIDQNQSIHHFVGKCQGTIALQERGTQGFGYDSVFIPENSSKTFGEMELSEKLPYSHRTRAVEALLKFYS